MISTLKELNAAVRAMTRQAGAPLGQEWLDAGLSVSQRQLVQTGTRNQAGLFHPSYRGWRSRRCDKIMEIYGPDTFAGRKILELGAGHGDIGAFFAGLGAEVLGLDGRAENVELARCKHRKVERLRFEQFNLENDFSQFGRFDLILDLGLLYHLTNVDAHLRCCFATSDDIILESVVCDSSDPHKIFFLPERKEVDEEALEGIGSRPSPFYIERLAGENGFDVIRYFTPDLNYTHQFLYDWQHSNDERISEDFVLRRFWRLEKSTT